MSNTITIIIGISIIFIATTIGATFVFLLKKEINKKINAIISGFSAGIMISASIFGLIIPSLSYADYLNELYFLPSIIGLLAGALFLSLIEFITKKINNKGNSEQKNKTIRFVIAFTIHNIPEGMAVGFAFGLAYNSGLATSLASALGLAIAIAIQNIPEGMAVAFPVYKNTNKKTTGFLYGMLSGLVEPIFAIVGLYLASGVAFLLPWLLSFSAGAMFYVSLNDLIPEAKESTNNSIGTYSAIIGFIIMMLLDILL